MITRRRCAGLLRRGRGQVQVKDLNPLMNGDTGPLGTRTWQASKNSAQRRAFMSLVGYLQYLVDELKCGWPTYAETARVATQPDIHAAAMWSAR